jgi:integral membrane protein (TIGR01906 family)
VYNRITIAGIVAALVLVGGLAILRASRHARRRAPAALLGGGLLTLGLLGAVGATMVLSWGEFFTTFHRIFFEGDTWTFPYSDTLIRLFPMRFWIDVAVAIVTLLVVQALVLAGLGRLWTRRTAADART